MILSEQSPIRGRILTIQCDSCKRIDSDPVEIEEYLIYNHVVGYRSKTFVDSDHLELHLCQYCKYKLLSTYIRITSNE